MASPLIFDKARYYIGLGYDWTAGNTWAVVLRKNAWTPAEGNGFVQTAITAGATEPSTSSPGWSGTDRQHVTSPTVALVSGSAYWNGNGLSYPGIPAAAAFDTLLLYNKVTGDSDSWLIAYYDLGSQTGDGANVTINPAANGYCQW